MNAISAQKLSKQYTLGSHGSGSYVALRDIISAPFSGKSSQSKFWAMKNVSFEVEQGEVFGIIGANGAGKSTLLKILSKITPPTRGTAKLQGQVGSLLEVGTGFHPELTGRENIFLNGALLGMSRSEIRRNFDDIVIFSGVEEFLDTPVKRYSSGMQVRLAFAVAAHLEPEILLVDEVLAVGDAQFQKKSFGKMEQVTQNDGRTILFVSHNMNAVQKLCKRSMLLDKGELVMIDNTEKVIHEYLNKHAQQSGTAKFPGTRNKPIHIRRVSVKNSKNKVTSRIDTAKEFSIEVEYDVEQDLGQSYVGVAVVDLASQSPLINSLDTDANPGVYTKRKKGRHISVFTYEPNTFNDINAKLFVHAGVFPASPERVDKFDGAVTITFFNSDNYIIHTLDGRRNASMLTKIESKIIRK